MTTVKTLLDAAASERIRYPRSSQVPETDVYRAIERVASDAAAWGPMDGQYVIMDETTTLDRWFGGLTWSAASDELVLVEQIGTGHIQNSSMIIVRKSQDGGDTWRGLKTIFSRESDPFIRASAFTAFSSTRMAGILNTGDLTRKTWYVETNDGWATGTVTEITSDMALGSHFVYGQIIRWPAAAGGHDTTGWQVLSYGGANTDVKAIRTADNGANWTDATIKTSSGLPGAAQEPSLVQLSDGRWFVIVRTTANGNAWAAVAPEDMGSWSDWWDTGIPLGSNTVHALVDGDECFVNVIYRDGFPAPGGDSTLADDNTVVAYRAKCSDIIAGAQLTARKTMARAMDRLTGYPQSCQDNRGNWYHALKIGEGDSTVQGSGSSLCIVREIKGAVRGVGSVPAVRQLIEDPTFTQWPRGDTVSASSTTGQWFGRFFLHPSGATVTVTKTEVPQAVRACVPNWSMYGAVIDNTGSANDFVGFQHRWLGDDAKPMALDICNRQRVTSRIWGWGTFPANLRSPFVVNNADAVRAATTSTFPVPVGIEGDAPWVTEVTYRTEHLDDISIAPSAVTSCYFSIDNGAASTEFTLQLASWEVFLGVPPLEVSRPPLVSPSAATTRYCQRYATTANAQVASGEAESSTILWGVLFFEPLCTSSPTVTAGDPSNFQVRSGGVTATATGVSFAAVTRSRCRMAVTTSGLTLGRGGNIEVVNPPSSSYIDIVAGT